MKSFLQKIKSVVFALLMLGSAVTFGATETYSAYIKGSQVTTGALVTVQDLQYPTMQSGASTTWGFTNTNSDGFIEAGVDNSSTIFVSAAYNVDLVYQVSYWSYSGSAFVQTNLTPNVVLNVAYDPFSGATYNDKARHRIAGASRMEVTLVNVYQHGTTTPATVPSNLYTELLISATRYYTFDETTPPAGSSMSYVNLDLNGDGINDEVELHWDYIPGAESYDLEWTYINDYKGVVLDGSNTNDFYTSAQIPLSVRNFELNNTRVSLTDQYYRIPLTFEHGYLVYRIRGIGKGGSTAGDFSKFVPGKWSTDAMLLAYVGDYPNVIPVQAHQNFDLNTSASTLQNLMMNWQVKNTYAEEGKSKTVISYFDGSLRNRQTVTRMNSDNRAIVGETIYDYQGRGAVQTLPVPSGESAIHYNVNFNRNNAGAPYSKDDFDRNAVNTCAVTEGAMDSVSGASRYYSSNNNIAYSHRDYVPIAKGYPFTLVEYEPDNTGRIRTQTGAGVDHNLGSGHETKNYYGQPEQVQLDRVFASEAGYKQHYKKNMVVDANGQASVTYLDMKGKVIATSLAGDSTGNLLALVDPQTSAPQQTLIGESIANGPITVDLLNKQNPTDVDTYKDDNNISSDGMHLTYSGEKMVSSSGIYTFMYQVQNTSFTNACLSPYCYPLVYDINVHVKDQCGQEMLTTPVNAVINADYQTTLPAPCTNTGTTICPPLPTSCTAVNQLYNYGTGLYTAALPLGEYTVEKDLAVDQTALDYLASHYVQDATNLGCLKTLQNFTDYFVANQVSGGGCAMTCADCIANLIATLGTRAAYIATGSGDGTTAQKTAQWDALYNDCNESCRPISLCQTEYGAMLEDVSPNGQYGKTTAVAGSNDMALSVFNESNQLPYNSTYSAPLPNWRHPVPDYQNASSQTSYVTLTVVSGAYSPAIVPTATLYSLPSGQQGVKPQDLANLNDFINIWDVNWAKSLVKYHPEYPYYVWCNPLATVLPADTYSSDDFDYAMENSSTYSGAQSTVITNSSPASGVTSTTVDLTSYLTIVSNDPFFHTGNPGAANLNGVSAATIMNGWVNTQYPGAPSLMTMPKFVVMTTNCGSWFGQDAATSCPGYTETFGSNTATRDAEWAMFKSLYLSLKQRLMQELADQTMISNHNSNSNTTDGYNGCIGNNSFNDYAGQPLVPAGFTGAYVTTTTPPPPPCYDSYEPCGHPALYSNKSKRYGFADLSSPSYNSLSNTADENFLTNTGLCPLAENVQDLLKAMATSNALLSTNIPLLSVGNFSPKLYEAISGVSLSTSTTVNISNTNYYPYSWTGAVTSSTQLSITLSEPGGHCFPSGSTLSTCTGSTITINLPSSSSLAWSNYGTGTGQWSFANLSNFGPTSNSAFNIQAEINPHTTGVSNYLITVSGTTCFPLTSCQTSVTQMGGFACPPSTEALSLQDLMNQLSVNGDLTSTSGVALQVAPYNSIFNTVLASYLPSGTWSWKETAVNSNQFVVYDPSHTSNTIPVTFNSATPTLVNGATFTGIMPNYNYSTATGGDDNNFVVTVTISGSSSTSEGLVLLGNDTYAGNHTGTCSTGAAMLSCQDPENKYLVDLQTLLGALVNGSRTTNNSGATGLNVLTGTQWFSTQMQSFLSIKGGETFVADGTVTPTTFSIPIKQLISGTPDPAVFCTISLSLNDNSGNPMNPRDHTTGLPAAIDFTTVNQIYSIWADESVTNNGQSFNFIADVGTSTGSELYLYGTSCFPIKNCTECPPHTEALRYGGGSGTTSAPDCSTSYTNYMAYLTANHLDSDPAFAISSVDFCAEGLNNCSAAYTSYLTALNINSVTSPHYFTLFQFCDGGYAPCYQNYVTYVQALDVAMAGQNKPYPPSLYLLPNDLCQYSFASGMSTCGNDYLAYLYSWKAASPAPTQYPINITMFCGRADLTKDNTCVSPTPPTAGSPSVTPGPDPCAAFLANIAAANALAQYNQYISSVIGDFKKAYIAQCIGSAVEQFTMTYTEKEYHFTLYYYDQAGNLVRTVPPQGVQYVPSSQLATVASDRLNGTQTVYTTHRLQTIYSYNSLNQLIRQQTPDAGQSQFWYDALGRLVVSQNAQQAPNNQYSYTLYDNLGRITEVGQTVNSSANTYGALYTITRDVSGTPLSGWIAAGTRTEVTATYYDDPEFGPHPNPFGSLGQQNLRNRISSVTYEDTYDGNPATYDHGTHYSYDIHGNVLTLVQDNLNMVHTAGFTTQEYKRIDYNYDLISGKVNEVMYQQGQPDQFYHQYLYDADNRITEVQTSSDNVLWDKDAKYFYYPHGPLARMESGDNKVQGVDYAYTIQGWIIGVNDNTLNESRDMGKDGYTTLPNLDAKVARDEFGYSLGYFTNDYLGIGQAGPTPNQTQTSSFIAGLNYVSPTNTSTLDAASPQLFNGNIRHMVTAIRKFMPNSTDVPQAMVYDYDQLNRIKHAKMYNNIDMTNNVWLTGTQSNFQYWENESYDGNGNIIRLNRNGNLSATPDMDRMKYYYYTQSNSIYDPEVSTPLNATNQLAYVTDASASSNYADDIDNQSASNYSYNYIGQLKGDNAEQIAQIDWTVYGKIKRITRTSTSTKPDLEFRYDASGNRISKLVKPRTGFGYVRGESWTTTYYIRDAQGNVMAVYNQHANPVDVPAFYLEEQDIYGSSRIGLKNSLMDMATASLSSTDYIRNLGSKNYEMSNHLGNVLVTVSDVAVPNAISGSPTTVAYYSAQVNSASDFTPFGSPMEGRNFTATGSTGYRYGFNGKEKDDETFGGGDEYNYGERIYDPRIGKFMSLDPLEKKYPELTPYQFASNTPIQAIDIDGLEQGAVRNLNLANRNGVQIVMKVTENDQMSAIDAKARQSAMMKSIPVTKNVAETTFPTENQNMQVAVSFSAGYKKWSTEVNKKELPLPIANKKEAVEGNPVQDVSHTDNTASILILAGGTESMTKKVWVTSNIYDTKGNIIIKNATFTVLVTETKQTMQMFGVAIETKSLYVNGQKVSSMYRTGIDLTKGFEFGKAKNGFSVGVNGILELKTDYKDIPKH